VVGKYPVIRCTAFKNTNNCIFQDERIKDLTEKVNEMKKKWTNAIEALSKCQAEVNILYTVV
jgi:hypothetical protein